MGEIRLVAKPWKTAKVWIPEGRWWRGSIPGKRRPSLNEKEEKGMGKARESPVFGGGVPEGTALSPWNARLKAFSFILQAVAAIRDWSSRIWWGRLPKWHFILIDLFLVHRVSLEVNWRGGEERRSLGLEQWTQCRNWTKGPGIKKAYQNLVTDCLKERNSIKNITNRIIV